ncbi:MAG: PTS sugar transporter subunit IIB [Oscillospiraceae bacterium]|nr:PTS sugar transporter subunit IIB [Oscillospiraceae bacterium]
MYKIALVCENGASTGLCVKKMVEYAKNNSIDCDINAYPDYQLSSIVDDKDWILLGPQIAFKLDSFREAFGDKAKKMSVIPPMDFGMMDGKKILTDTIKAIENK